MSFADRLKKRTPMALAAVRPTKTGLVSLCLPQMLVLEDHAVGLVNLELAPLVVGGMSSIRLLDALDELFEEAERHAKGSAENPTLPGFGAELLEAATAIRQHLASVAAAADQAHAEHEATHTHGKDHLQ